MKGYKVFNGDWTCRGFQYEVGKAYEMEEEPRCCKVGFHFCEKLSDCFSYYDFDSNNKVAEVVALGDINTDDDGKSCTNKIEIIRELNWNEVLEKCNTGKGNTGHSNSGDRNSGHSNSGDRNSGHRNSGHRNSGNRNSGDRNSGHRNSGDYNSGDWNSGNSNSGEYNSGNRNSGNSNSGYYNSGHRNSGYWNSGYSNSGDYNSGEYNSGNRNSGNSNSGYYNSGHRNSGYWNSGYSNSGDYNSGDYNSGDWNSGNSNSGDYNSGDWNSGNWNSGDWNLGHRNSGDWNKTNASSGCFNTKTLRIFMFDKLSDITLKDWYNMKARYILDKMPTERLGWISSEYMTDAEKKEYPEYQATGGILKLKNADNRQEWWDNLCESDKNEVLNIPNFDAKIFKEITGIEV